MKTEGDSEVFPPSRATICRRIKDLLISYPLRTSARLIFALFSLTDTTLLQYCTIAIAPFETVFAEIMVMGLVSGFLRKGSFVVLFFAVLFPGTCPKATVFLIP